MIRDNTYGISDTELALRDQMSDRNLSYREICEHYPDSRQEASTGTNGAVPMLIPEIFDPTGLAPTLADLAREQHYLAKQRVAIEWQQRLWELIRQAPAGWP